MPPGANASWGTFPKEGFQDNVPMWCFPEVVDNRKKNLISTRPLPGEVPFARERKELHWNWLPNLLVMSSWRGIIDAPRRITESGLENSWGHQEGTVIPKSLSILVDEPVVCSPIH